jgi:Na+/H+ antiporter NhaD/arsenite permease-like protein
MEFITVAVFVLGYILIALEHPIKINKAATALITGMICWTIFAVATPGDSLLQSSHFQSFSKTFLAQHNSPNGLFDIYQEYVVSSLKEHLNEISQILFFLIGAMTIVELIDSHEGFKFITDLIKTRKPKTLLWIVCWVAFFLSAVLDNLTTTIVMVSLVRKLIPNKDMRLFFVGMIVIAANAGGAWSPIGDVTTTMLWIGGQLTAGALIKALLLPSIICLLVPLIYLHFTLKGSLGIAKEQMNHNENGPSSGKLMFTLGLLSLVSVPIFKTYTHLPPFMGMLLGLGVLWVCSELINPSIDEHERKKYTAAYALSRIDMSSVLFFMGILLAVGALESMEMLHHLADFLNHSIGDTKIIITLIGILSAIIDNVPLVAASMGMYSLDAYPTDHMLWAYLAYCAGTGGSLLIIGSAAGIAAMGMEQVNFVWYLKRISALAFMGYIGGAVIYLIFYGNTL